MSNIAATDITITMLTQRRSEDGRRMNVVTLAFGDGALTYPAGGVPITKAKLGCPNIIEQLTVFDKGTSGYQWSYDRTNEKLVAFQTAAVTGGGSHTHTFSGTALGTHTHSIPAGTDGAGGTSGATSAGTPAGTNAANTFNLSAGVLAEPSTVAIAAQTLKVEVVGW